MKRFIVSVMSFASVLIPSLAFAASVPVPPEIQEKAAGITVTGETSSTQTKNAVIWAIKMDKHGVPIASWASIHDGIKSPLGKETNLPAGTYLVFYYGYFEVTLAPGDHKVIELGNISVPKIDGSYKVRAFLDDTNPAELNMYSLEAWILQQEQSYDYTTYNRHGVAIDSWSETANMKDYCAAAVAGTDFARECQAIKRGSLADYVRATIKVAKNGSYRALSVDWTRPAGGPPSFDSETWLEPAFYYLPFGSVSDAATFADGEFIGVLPGSYGVEITNISGKTTTRVGVVVK